MSLPDKAIKEFQEIFEKKYGKKLSWEEASESANRLVNLFKILHESDMRDRRRQLRLKDEPKGFHLEGGPYNCFICHASISNSETWYDKNGIKCLLCQKAVEKHIVPAKACKDKDSWYAAWEFDHYWGAKYQTVMKFVRSGKLKARVVPGSGFHVFMIKDNEGFLPPKPKSYTVKTDDNRFTIEYEKVESPFKSPQSQ